MNLAGLLEPVGRLPEYQAALAALRRAAPSAPGFALRLPRAARTPVAAALSHDQPGPTLIIAARTDRAATVAEELAAWAPGARVLTFNEPNPLFYEYGAWGPRTIYARLNVLAALTGADHAPEAPLIVVASARALMSRTLPRRDFAANTRSLQPGQPLRVEKTLEAWLGAGYNSATIVVEPGQFARRGGIIDIFPFAAALPARIELFGDEIDTLRQFDPASQRSGGQLASLTITPAREALPRYWDPAWSVEAAAGEEEAAAAGGRPAIPNLEFYLPRMVAPAGLLEYLPERALVLVDDWRELAATIEELEEQAVALRAEQMAAGLVHADDPLPYHPWAEVQDELASLTPAPVVLAAPDDETQPVIDLGARFHPGPRFGGQLKHLLDQLESLHRSADRTIVVTRQSQRLAELWSEQHPYLPPADSVTDLPPRGEIMFVPGALADGWRLDLPQPPEGGPAEALHLLTDAEIFGWARPDAVRARRRARPAARSPEANFADLSAGDYVVHMDFGIGCFRGLVTRAIEGLEREYLLLEYDQGDELYVPIHQADRLTRYIGVDENHAPSLSRLGSADWITAKSRTQVAVEAVAQDLLALYAKRAAVGGHAAGTDTVWQAELEASFPYVETDDQLRAIREVKADMESGRPMDRLICGDVGYGKTEVALRAAFKAVMDGSQVAVLVPTTVLAQQHLHTFQARLAPYPARVEMLSRFRTRAEADAIIAELAEGKIDIVIGTHRLVQKDVVFKNLGLVIIDEEQRFGVTHKEYFKKLRTEVDVLTLTATPIPRTLYLSLTGVRDISTINTPPEERLPVITHTGPFNERLVRQAILRELDRDGQVFFVHNRVQSIGVIRNKLESIVPEARLGIGHGQMDEHELARVMDAFTAGEIDVLLCTSIIESGLDIPNANTLIVDRADTFGLAQLYQLRGRVGRGAARAYAFFFTDRANRPTQEGYQRLETLAEQTDLGAGYGIAMRDLEMRGAGDILGVRQHGHIAAVGFHLYTQLLGNAVRRLKAQTGLNGAPLAATTGQASDELAGELATLMSSAMAVDLPIAASLPAAYIADRDLRLRIYRRLAHTRAEALLAEAAQELAERFGPLPEPAENLLYQLRVKILATRAGVSAIGSENGQIVLTTQPVGEVDQAYLGLQLGPGARVSKNKVWLGRAANPRAPDAPWRAQLLEVLRQMARLARPEAA
ncbi:MAG: transcription-repair coupling factor [Anaerolineales bacterium]|nr:transcription-repair coupling factor [Anaerolineales bacterium]